MSCLAVLARLGCWWDSCCQRAVLQVQRSLLSSRSGAGASALANSGNCYQLTLVRSRCCILREQLNPVIERRRFAFGPRSQLTAILLL